MIFNFSWFGFAYTRSWEVAKFLNYRYVKDGVKQTFFLFHSRFPLETRRFSVEREGKGKPARKGNKATSLYMVVVLKARSLWSLGGPGAGHWPITIYPTLTLERLKLHEMKTL